MSESNVMFAFPYNWQTYEIEINVSRNKRWTKLCSISFVLFQIILVMKNNNYYLIKQLDILFPLIQFVRRNHSHSHTNPAFEFRHLYDMSNRGFCNDYKNCTRWHPHLVQFVSVSGNVSAPAEAIPCSFGTVKCIRTAVCLRLPGQKKKKNFANDAFECTTTTFNVFEYGWLPFRTWWSGTLTIH